MEVNDLVETHYTRSQLGEVILSALAKAGKDLDHLTPEDLAPVDEFHVRGMEATRELAGSLAGQVPLSPAHHILDAGCGLGGASRYLASHFGCRVTGLDLTEEYCRTAHILADRLGFASRLTYRQGNALDMPFPNASFDVVWTQHASMNIGDKARLYDEIRRVLKPGGWLALYDILAGPHQPVHFPVPWAREPSISFLIDPDELRRLLEERGFRIQSWWDTTPPGLAWFQEILTRMEQGITSPLGLHLMMGADYLDMARNMVRNLGEGRIILVGLMAAVK
jgi:SAM-dependent methyltransferase